MLSLTEQLDAGSRTLGFGLQLRPALNSRKIRDALFQTFHPANYQTITARVNRWIPPSRFKGAANCDREDPNNDDPIPQTSSKWRLQALV
jgi:hypothetical protein